MIYDLSEKFHWSKVSGFQNYTMSPSPMLHLFTFGQVGYNIWNPSIGKTIDGERKLKDM